MIISIWGPVRCSRALRARCAAPMPPDHPPRGSRRALPERSRARPPSSSGGSGGACAGACLLVALDVVHDVLDGADLLRLLVRYLHVVLLLERHHQLHDVERVRAEILDEGGLRRDFLLAHAELVADDLLHLLLHAGSHHSSLAFAPDEARVTCRGRRSRAAPAR